MEVDVKLRPHEHMSVRVRRVLTVLAGLIAGPLVQQGVARAFYAAYPSRSGAWLFLGAASLVLLAAAAFWWRGKRWFASGIAAGVVAWSIFLMLFIIWFVRSMENFD